MTGQWKTGLQHWNVQPVFVQTSCQRHQCTQTRRRFCDTCNTAEFKEELSKHLFVKHIATLGPRPHLLDSCEVRFLNRVIRWVVPPFGKSSERIETEADPRHAELLIKNSGLRSYSKGVNTPGERPRDSLRTIKLSPQDSTSYRSNVMRLAYLSGDRIELEFASEEFARVMAEPTTADVEALKRCIRFLLKYPRCIQSFERQEIVPKQITCDSNFAGCLQSRKSTSSYKFIVRETSSEIYVNNTGGCQSLECRS